MFSTVLRVVFKAYALKWTTDAKAMDPHQTEKHDKVEESSSEAPGSRRELMSEPGELPVSYGETRVVLLPVEDQLLYVYWEVTPVELEKAKDKLGYEYGRSSAVLRCYYGINIILDGTNAHSFLDVDIDLQTMNLYVSLPGPEKSCFVELGFRTEDGRFHPIVRSNIAEMPPERPAPKTDGHYMLVAGDYDLVETVPVPVDVQPHKVAPRFYTSRSHRLRNKNLIPSDHERGNAADLVELCEKSFTLGRSSK
jgi:hypothetical protein